MIQIFIGAQLTAYYHLNTETLDVWCVDEELQNLVLANLACFTKSSYINYTPVISFIVDNIINLYNQKGVDGARPKHLDSTQTLTVISNSVAETGLYVNKHISSDKPTLGIFASTEHKAWNNKRWALVFNI